MKEVIRCNNVRSIAEGLRDWYSLPLGTLLAEKEQEELDRILPNLFGYHLLQLGEGGHNLLSASRILHRVVMSEGTAEEKNRIQIQGAAEQLPVVSDCIDALILYHTLEFTNDPRQVLREAERVLVPEGHIVVLGFNPQSLWGLMRMLKFKSETIPWCGRFLSTLRLKDWLALLGFEVISCRHAFHRPPIHRTGMLEKLTFLEKWGERWWPILGGVYVLVARKKVSTLTPIKPRWRPRRSIDSVFGDAASRSYEQHE